MLEFRVQILVWVCLPGVSTVRCKLSQHLRGRTAAPVFTFPATGVEVVAHGEDALCVS